MSKDFEEKNVEFVFEDEVEMIIENKENEHHPILRPLSKNEFQIKACEELKEVCVDSTIEDTVKLIKVKAKLSKLCPDRKVAIAVQLVDTNKKEIIAQKGKVVETGCSPKCTNTVYENFIFALPGCLCNESNVIKVNVIANYVLDYEYDDCQHCK